MGLIRSERFISGVILDCFPEGIHSGSSPRISANFSFDRLQACLDFLFRFQFQFALQLLKAFVFEFEPFLAVVALAQGDEVAAKLAEPTPRASVALP